MIRRAVQLRRSLLPGLLMLTSCGDRPAESARARAGDGARPAIVSIPLPARTAAAGSDKLFSLLAPEACGVSFIHPIDLTHPLKRLYAATFACGGVAVGDADGDGRADIFLTSGPRDNALFRQTEPWRFADVTAAAGLAAPGTWSAGASFADVDGDGDLDLYVCNYDAPNLLYVNNGRGHFTEAAGTWGVNVSDASAAAAFCDFDRDGDLDFYLLCSQITRDAGKLAETPLEIDPVTRKPRAKAEFAKYYRPRERSPGVFEFETYGREDYLFRNDGGRFTDVTKTAGVGSDGFGNSVTWWDFNEDGWLDLYVGNDNKSADRLLLNNKNGTFADAAALVLPHTTWFSMGADVADVNNDGRLDFMMADMSNTTHYMSKLSMGEMGPFYPLLRDSVPQQFMRNTLFINTGVPRFQEAALMTGMASTDWSWAIKFGDYDNNGRVDVFVTNGVARMFNDADHRRTSEEFTTVNEWDFYEKLPPLRMKNLAFKNDGGLRFSKTGAAWGLDFEGMTYSAASGDLDGDGDLDLVTCNLDDPVHIYRNESTAGHAVNLRLHGARGNSRGIGVRVELVSRKLGRQVRQLIPDTGFLSCNEPMLHFGLGDDTEFSLTVYWPSGHTQQVAGLKADHLHEISEPGAAATPQRLPEDKTPPMFTAGVAPAALVHKESPFNDFAREPLLPNAMSQWGPGLALGDIDGDGDDDLFMGGAAGYPGQLLRNEGGGRFLVSFQAGFEQDAAAEDMGAVFFDADGDDDQDLFVASGGNECSAEDEVLRDRLYLNDGRGDLTKSTTSVPDLRDSGGPVAVADFDRDGDLDIFAGSRSVPGRYPETPESRLLQNDGGVFTDVTESAAPALRLSGLVTSAVWTDADGDGWIDLLTSNEWGPVKFFHNRAGKLVDETKEAGLAQFSGWWNSLAAADIDHDGDIDCVAANFGLNTKYKASPEHPELIFFGDLDGSGKKNIVEAKFEKDTLYPVRGLSCSSHAMPEIRKRLPTFRAFASASLQDIYGERLSHALRLECHTLESGVFVNDGKARFTFRPLPREAQISPGFGLCLTDVNGDGHCDCVMVQNFSSPQIETGRMNSGLGQLLLGDGKGGWQVIGPRHSGIVLPGDGRALVATDFEDDGCPDFVAAMNNGPAHTLKYAAPPGPRRLKVRLAGLKGNPTAIGSRVQVTCGSSPPMTAEVTAGAGYLSQQSSALIFGLGKETTAASVDVRWPDGTVSTHTAGKEQSALVIKAP
ncbi:MAG: FG-GAP-like repeat-containing protein [Verrucomicrobiales bacterium]